LQAEANNPDYSLTMTSWRGNRYSKLWFGYELGGPRRISFARSDKGGERVLEGNNIPRGWAFYDIQGIELKPDNPELLFYAVKANGAGREWELQEAYFIAERPGKTIVIKDNHEFVEKITKLGYKFSLKNRLGISTEVSVDEARQVNDANLAYVRGSTVRQVLNGYAIPDGGDSVAYGGKTYKVTPNEKLPEAVVFRNRLFRHEDNGAIPRGEAIIDPAGMSAKGIRFFRAKGLGEEEVDFAKAEYAKDSENKRYKVVVRPKGLWLNDGEVIVVRNLEALAGFVSRGYSVLGADGKPVYDTKEIEKLN